MVPGTRGSSKHIVKDRREFGIYLDQYWPGNTATDHLTFALKYEGINLEILKNVFNRISVSELECAIRETPNGKYARSIWYLYEYLTGNQLDIPDLKQGNYHLLLNPSVYITTKGERSSRHKILDNQLGQSAEFCPSLRRTPSLERYLQRDIKADAQKIVSAYPDEILQRTISYLYTKETKSSFALEREEPSANRTTRFVELLKNAHRKSFLSLEGLVEIQNRLVENRFRESGYRTTQNYVGQSIRPGQEIIHFIPPKPEDVGPLMRGLIETNGRLDSSSIHPVLNAAITSFGFNIIHPFEDGNGRIHRFLMHNILAIGKLIPAESIFPISAAMLNNKTEYDKTLESYSIPLLGLLNYNLNAEGELGVSGETADHYRYLDFTYIAERLFWFIDESIDTELKTEFEFLVAYDTAIEESKVILELPDRLLDLFIKLVTQNNGHLSPKKRQHDFHMLSDTEIEKLEEIVRRNFQKL